MKFSFSDEQAEFDRYNVSIFFQKSVAGIV